MNTPALAQDALSGRSSELAERLADLLEEFDVPGAAFAIARGDELVQGAAGVLTRETGLTVTSDSWFQIGSITKLFTATLVMQLADEHLVDLDGPVRDYLPSFDVGDAQASGSITVRQLLTHTSGIHGDYFADFGRGGDAVARYVASLRDVGMLHRPGELFSYCNSGFCVLGLLVQTLRDDGYDSVLTERLLRPLGIAGGTLAEQAMLHRAAVGHVEGPDGSPAVPAPVWALPYSSGPAGSTPFMDPAGLVSFARMHLADGVAPDGTRLLSPWAVAEMQRPQASIPTAAGPRGIGASWIRYGWGGETMLGHDGGTVGQYAFLRVHPASGSIVVLLTNGPGGPQLFEAFGEPLLTEITGLPAPAPLAVPDSPPVVDATRLIGRYRHHGLDLRVTAADGRISIATSPQQNPDIGEDGQVEEFSVVGHSVTDDAVFLVSEQRQHGSYVSLMFPAAEPGGSAPPGYLRMGSRVFARAAG